MMIPKGCLESRRAPRSPELPSRVFEESEGAQSASRQREGVQSHALSCPLPLPRSTSTQFEGGWVWIVGPGHLRPKILMGDAESVLAGMNLDTTQICTWRPCAQPAE